MTQKQLPPHMIWLFAAGATAIGVGVGALDLGTSVSMGAYFAVFAAAGFASTGLTSAKKGMAFLAMMIAAGVTATLYYAIIGSAVGEATTAMASLGGDADGAAKAGGFMGTFFGIAVAFVTLVNALVAGIGGAIVGARVRAQRLEASLR